MRWGDRVPDGPEYTETERPELIERRELSAPWADEEFSRARTRLFLAALALHKAFILNAGPRLSRNLNAMMDILDGVGRPKDEAAILAAWQTLFLVVPVVSTTFASVGRMFAGLRRESLGWLLVDEAGQAAPQNAVGALWRCRRAVIVGDPLQLEPVVTLPWGGQRALLEEFKVAPGWAPSRSSAQQLADRLATAGTWLPGPAGEGVWVGAPLRVHRRCDRPMFEASNMIAYNGPHGVRHASGPEAVSRRERLDRCQVQRRGEQLDPGRRRHAARGTRRPARQRRGPGADRSA